MAEYYAVFCDRLMECSCCIHAKYAVHHLTQFPLTQVYEGFNCPNLVCEITVNAGCQYGSWDTAFPSDGVLADIV